MSETKNQTAFDRLRPAEYNAILKDFALDSIVVQEMHMARYSDKLPTMLDGSFTMLPSGMQRGKGEATFNAKLGFVASIPGSSEKLAEVNAQYAVRFRHPGEVSDDFLEIFSKVTLSLMVWPYARELVFAMTHRMGLPPFTAPMMISPSVAETQ